MSIDKTFLHLNSEFRDDKMSEASNFIYTLPRTVHNVVAIRLHAIDALQVTNVKYDYLFLCLEDYNEYNDNEYLVCLDRKSLNKRVLGKIQITNDTNTGIISSDFTFDTNPRGRLFQQRRDLTRVHISLLDYNGDSVISSDFGLTLEIDILNNL